MMNLDEYVNKGWLTKIKSDKAIIAKELEAANYDLSSAKNSLENKDYKWCIVKSYYAIFHSSRALLFKLGFKEKNHFVIGIILEELSKEGKLENKFANDFYAAKDAREDADYRSVYSAENAEYFVDLAEEFIKKINELLRI